MYFTIKFLIVIVLNVLAIKQISSHPSGAPTAVCDDLIPHHNKIETQTSRCPFQLIAHYSNDSIELIIKSSENVNFRGFAIQVRKNDTDSGTEPIGHFVPTDSNSHTIKCGGPSENTLTHSDRKDKQKLIAKWVAPDDLDKDELVQFYGTVLKDVKTFWTNQISEPFSLNSIHESNKDNTIDEHHSHHNKDSHSDHESGSHAKTTNSSPNNANTSLDYLLILSAVIVLFRQN